jgi:hypothetical protein
MKPVVKICLYVNEFSKNLSELASHEYQFDFSLRRNSRLVRCWTVIQFLLCITKQLFLKKSVIIYIPHVKGIFSLIIRFFKCALIDDGTTFIEDSFHKDFIRLNLINDSMLICNENFYFTEYSTISRNDVVKNFNEINFNEEYGIIIIDNGCTSHSALNSLKIHLENKFDCAAYIKYHPSKSHEQNFSIESIFHCLDSQTVLIGWDSTSLFNAKCYGFHNVYTLGFNSRYNSKFVEKYLKYYDYIT